MKFFNLLFFLLIGLTASAQLQSGDLVDEKRPLVIPSTFKLSDANAGVVFLEIAVNRKGEVTSAKVDTEGTTVVSTPSRIKAVAFAKKLKFQEGTHFPEFHHARVKLILTQP